MTDKFRYRHLLYPLVLVLVTVAAYWQLRHNGFVNFDDDIYVTANPQVQQGFTADGIRWAFSFMVRDGNYWHPLTWLSLMGEYQLFGLQAAGYHLVNLSFHILNSLLLFVILGRMTGRFWPSAFVAALFAIHPINVESVAWVVEWKTVLSSFFWMLTILAYERYARQPGLGRYAMVFISLAVGLMAKSMLVSLPFVLLLLDYWPLGRIARIGTAGAGQPAPFGRLLLEKLPLLGLSLLSVAISILSLQGTSSVIEYRYASLADRLANALVSYVAYLGKLFWPSGLAVYYPLPPGYPLWQVVGAGLLLLAITVGALLFAKGRPWLLVGWFWYLGVMFPVAGLVRAGVWPALADRFAYLPFIGLFIIIAWGGAELADSWRLPAPLLPSIAVVVCSILALLTFRQVAVWGNSITLFENEVQHAAPNGLAYHNLAEAYYQEGKHEQALAAFRNEQQINPLSLRHAFAQGYSLLRRGELRGASQAFSKLLFRDPGNLDALLYLAKAQEGLGDNRAALENYRRYQSALAAMGPGSAGADGEVLNSIKRLESLLRQQPMGAAR